ncbi:hypothetical protein TA3x_004289 [Tundrisphaera sp. TA3]|uniref:hypothetical protein n=1 Tax=Tundrisphaera sp. TA3 TaxID=3435775 RepID=UPI003EB93967
MAASSNESFGLKVTTAICIALTVVMLVGVYFLNSSYNEEYARRTDAEKKAADAGNSLREATNQANEYRKLLGYETLEDFEAAKAQIKKDETQLKADIQSITNEVTAMVTDFQKKADAKSIDTAQFEAMKTKVRELTDAFLNNADQSAKANMVRLKDLMANLSRTTSALSLNYIDLRNQLEKSNEVNNKARSVLEETTRAAKAELEATIKGGEEAREELVAANRKYADDIAILESKMTNMANELTAKLEGKTKTVADLSNVLRDLRDEMSKKEDVMDKPGGRVTFVDYASNIVRVNVNRSMGVRPLMRFTIFDKNASGIPSDKPKATVELVKVGDPQKGETDSLARIIRTDNPTDPIRYNDYIYSVGWSYDRPQRFDLIGKIDMNRDGKDDRADLIRMIEQAGGVIEFDLPPPNVDREPGKAAVARTYARLNQPVPTPTGRAAGRITGLSFAYVTDTLPPLVSNANKEEEATKEESAYLAEQSQATKEARDNGVRPLPLEKLLVYLGYNQAAPSSSRRELYDKNGVEDLLKPRQNSAQPAAPTAESPQ